MLPRQHPGHKGRRKQTEREGERSIKSGLLLLTAIIQRNSTTMLSVIIWSTTVSTNLPYCTMHNSLQKCNVSLDKQCVHFAEGFVKGELVVLQVDAALITSERGLVESQ